MTKKEVAEIFAVLMIAYPNAEMFRGGSQQEIEMKLGPTITLWAACLRDVDFWMGQKAVIKLCQTCKFPPTIAEMREATEAVSEEIKAEINTAYLMARNEVSIYGGDLDKAYAAMSTRTRKTIDAMGGMEAFAPADKPYFNLFEFERTYEQLLRSNPIGLPGAPEQKRLT